MHRKAPRLHAFAALFILTVVAGIVAPGLAAASSTPIPNSAVIKERIFNDCPSSTLTSVNSYPALISIEDAVLDCSGFANLHNWRFSEDGVDAAVFNNDASFTFSADMVIEGDGNGEAGLQIAPWWSPDVDGRFNVRSTDGEIACFGGRLPFYSFTGSHGINYVKGDVIHLAMVYSPNGLSSTEPATIEYKLTYLGTDYTSGPLPFDEGNPAEDPPYGLWGMLNDGRAGGYFQAFLTGGTPSTAKVTWSDVGYSLTHVPTPNSAVVKERIFNDCPTTTVTSVNDYPALISIEDAALDCFAFANLHNWRFSEDGVDPAQFNNNASFRVSAYLVIEGDGNGEAGLQIAPWWSPDVDGRFNVRSTDGEIACFGGRLPFYSFTGEHGINYMKGASIHLEMIYEPNGLSETSPATIEYKLTYMGADFTSGKLPFDGANPAEDPPYGRWGMLNNGQVGGYFQAFMTPAIATTAKASWSNIAYSACPRPANVAIDVKPHSLKLGSKPGKLVTVYVNTKPKQSKKGPSMKKKKSRKMKSRKDPGTTLRASDIDIASLRLNGVPVSSEYTPKISKKDTKLKVKFDRQALEATLMPGKKVPVMLTGSIGMECIEAVDLIKVKAPKKMPMPAQNEQLLAGTETTVAWEVDPDIPATKVALLFSFDDGVTWTAEAVNIANTGSYVWTVPNVVTSTARLAVATIFEQDEGGFVTDAEISSSHEFSIMSPLTVGDNRVSFALRGALPNPASGTFNVSFTLPTAQRATLVLFDVSGRRILAREVGGLGPGAHLVKLGERIRLAPGSYMVRLTQGERSLSTQVMLIR